MPDLVRLIISVSVCEVAGIIGSIFTTPAIPTWYAALAKPPFTPPPWLFGPVWLTLYALMGIALFLVWRQGAAVLHVQRGLALFVLQLLLNILWPAVFFGMRSPLYGMIVIVLLWLAILATILQFGKVSELASYLLIPYILWVSFAAVLNLSIFILNR
ncbi:tryptophan-rich sensory protein [candidate division WOR-3 bacterium]|nr:tryptophan-rich sensory protein [candidate division WOR-3 bacterium]